MPHFSVSYNQQQQQHGIPNNLQVEVPLAPLTENTQIMHNSNKSQKNSSF